MIGENPKLTTREIAVWHGGGMAPAAMRGAVCAIGNFDGVHHGHRALLAEAFRIAASMDRPVALVTFEPHPRTVFNPGKPVFRLTPAPVRRSLLAELGCAAVAELVFDRNFAGQSAAEFVETLLLDAIDASGVVVGDDFAYGHGRSGNAASLKAAFARLSRPVSVVAPVLDEDGQVVSSSRIRTALAHGNLMLANALLGYRWRVEAEVVHGDKRGRLLGYPTANMLLSPDNQLRHGIYAVRIRIAGEWRPGIASFGRRPTFDDGAPRLEAFVFDFDGDLYGQILEVEFADWIRGEEKFDNIAALIVQMDADSQIARNILRQIAKD
ncbi:MAG: bifunctional riboflavin kinase/FAD synthetase [Bosea sp. (in: a-proteobacteria)]